jgi:anti-sigma B factor antagonist
MTGLLDEVPFEVAVDHEGDAVRVRVAGELDLFREGALRAAVTAVLDAGDLGSLVLDVCGLQFLDSSGLRALLVCRDRTKEAGAEFRLAVAPGPVTRLLAVAGVQGWFDYE